MSNTEQKYNGWANWDTWNAYLLLSNDEYLYKRMRSVYSPASAASRGIELLESISNPDKIDYDNVLE